MVLRSLAFVSLVTLWSSTLWGGDWPAFRGAGGDGVSDETGIALTWGPEKNIRWRFALPGPGNSSPIVYQGRAFITCAEEAGKKRSTYCLDQNDGTLLWQRTVEYSESEATHQTNPYCGSTPVAFGDSVVVWHGSAGLFCYDLDGQQKWQTDLGKVGHIWGYGSSPVHYDGLLYLNFGPGAEQYVCAIDPATGKTVWRVDEPGGQNAREPRMVGSWSTPAIIPVDGRIQVVCSMPTRVVAYQPKTGEVLWTCGGIPSTRGDLVYTSVLASKGIGVAMGGYQGPAMAFQLGGSGDVTTSHRLWHVERRQPQRIGSGIILDDVIYMANAGPGTIQCIDLKSGDDRWVERLSGDHWGSLVFVDGHLMVTNQAGVTRVFRPNPDKYDPVASNDLKEPSNSTPAVSNGKLYLRTFSALYCIDDES